MYITMLHRTLTLLKSTEHTVHPATWGQLEKMMQADESSRTPPLGSEDVWFLGIGYRKPIELPDGDFIASELSESTELESLLYPLQLGRSEDGPVTSHIDGLALTTHPDRCSDKFDAKWLVKLNVVDTSLVAEVNVEGMKQIRDAVASYHGPSYQHCNTGFVYCGKYHKSATGKESLTGITLRAVANMNYCLTKPDTLSININGLLTQ